jgi:hypothetical protein
MQWFANRGWLAAPPHSSFDGIGGIALYRANSSIHDLIAKQPLVVFFIVYDA